MNLTVYSHVPCILDGRLHSLLHALVTETKLKLNSILLFIPKICCASEAGVNDK